MKNCKFTTLKGVIDNGNLPIYGKFKIYLKSLEGGATNLSAGLRNIISDQSITLKIKGTPEFATLNQNNELVSLGVQEITHSDTTPFYFTNGDGILIVPDSIKEIRAVSGAVDVKKNWYIDTNEFKNSTSLEYIQLSNSDSYGNIHDFVNNGNLSGLTFKNNLELEGDISKFVEDWIDLHEKQGGETLHIGGVSSGVYLYDNHLSNSEYNVTVDSATQFTVSVGASASYRGVKTNSVWSFGPYTS